MIYYFVRGHLFSEVKASINKNGQILTENLKNEFEQSSDIGLYEYRENLWKISKEGVSNIIEGTFMKINKDCVDKILSLDDNDLIIPFDDDDWLSPELENICIDYDIVFWKSYRLNLISSVPKKLSLIDVGTEKILSCSYGVKVFTLNKMYSMGTLENFILKHSIADNIIKSNIFKSTFINELNAVALRHLGSFSSVKQGLLQRDVFRENARQFIECESLIKEDWINEKITKLKDIFKKTITYKELI